jgi:GntR family galactonate operon transcriptional repressor
VSKLRTRHQHAVDRLGRWIAGGRFGPDAAMPKELDLGEALGVSRTVVREAMRTLVAKGMVEVRRRHGTRVRPLQDWNLFDPQVLAWRLERGPTSDFVEDLVAFRLGFEPYAASLAARNPDFPADALNGAYERMAAAIDGHGDYHEADLAFHETILTGARNQFLHHLAPFLTGALRMSFNLSVLDLETARAALPLHRAVADAILRRDPDRAAAALGTLIESARLDILVGLERRGDGRNGTDEEGGRQPVQAT